MDSKTASEKGSPSDRTERLTTQFAFAGFWKRVAAALIDSFVLVVAGMIGGFMLGIAYALVLEKGSGAEFAGQVFGTLLGWLYFAGFESSSFQATLGKNVLNMNVTDLEGRRISFAKATGRHFGKIISTITLLIGYLMAGFTEKKQTLHDKMAGCLVVNDIDSESAASPSL